MIIALFSATLNNNNNNNNLLFAAFYTSIHYLICRVSAVIHIILILYVSFSTYIPLN
jgi:hypothetical protein